MHFTGCKKKDDAQIKNCPHADVTCGGHEFLPNGARAYWDHGYVEYATPGCMTTSDAVAAVRAGDRIIQQATAKLQEALAKDAPITVVRNNIDHGGHTFGAHVNIRMTRQGYDRIFNDSDVLNGFVVPFFVTLPVICGSGRCSSEDSEEVFQIWQRADFLKELVGLQTTYDRPLINARDESLAADPQKYARFHIIAFDANRMEVAEYLKLGLLRLLCATIDAGRIDVALKLDDPITAIRSVSRQLFESTSIRLASNKTMTPLQIQRVFLAAFAKLQEDGVFVSRVRDAANILKRWGQVLTKLEKEPFGLFGSLDWITKYVWLEQIRSTKGLKWYSDEMKWLDTQYHCLAGEVTPDLPCERITTDQQVTKLVTQAPKDSRANIRAELLRMFGNKISLANWHYVVSFEDKCGYLLPDESKSDSTEAIRGAKTLKEAAASLNLSPVQLYCIKELQVQDNETSGRPEEQIFNH